MLVEFDIAVLPVVKAYLSHRYNVEPFDVYRTNQYGIFLTRCLTKMVPEDQAPMNPRYSETLTLRTNDWVRDRTGWQISNKHQLEFNSMVMDNLDEAFYNWMQCSDSFGGKLRNHYLSFREHYGLNEDNLTLKNMEKKYERFRQRVTA